MKCQLRGLIELIVGFDHNSYSLRVLNVDTDLINVLQLISLGAIII
jgi:hypothetical protein